MGESCGNAGGDAGVDAGGRWWTLVDAGGCEAGGDAPWRTLGDACGHWGGRRWTLVDVTTAAMRLGGLWGL